MEIVENIPVFNRYSIYRDETKYFLKEVYEAIKEYGAVITLNQALLLKEYESNLRVTLYDILEEMYKESLSYGLENEFFINWVITPEHIKDCNITEEHLNEFKTYQEELKIVENIKTILSTHTGGLQEE